jgi:hypothetical protein
MSPIGPARHRLHDYEAGWLTLLVKMGIATRAEAREAQHRVARQTLEDIERSRQRQRIKKQRRKRGEERDDG